MTTPETGIDWQNAALALGAGFLLGLAFFATLRRNAEYYAQGRPLTAGAIQTLRFLLLGTILLGAAQFGAIPLLTCTLGLFAGRQVVMRFTGREP